MKHDQVRIQLHQLGSVEQRFAAGIAHTQQIGDIDRGASLAERNHSVDGVRFTDIQRLAVGRVQFRQFLFAGPAVRHAYKHTQSLSQLQDVPQPKYRMRWV